MYKPRPLERLSEPVRSGFGWHLIEVKSRTKSVYSIYNKMMKKNIPLEEVYDVFAIRIHNRDRCLAIFCIEIHFQVFAGNDQRLGHDRSFSLARSQRNKTVQPQLG